MLFTRFTHRVHVAFVLCALCAAVFGSSSKLDAQGEVRTIEIMQGEVFELGIHTTLREPEYSWVLTRDHEFMKAERLPFFQTRQSAPGEYKLDVSIQDRERTRSEHYAFLLVINEGALPRRDIPAPVDAVTPVIATVPSPDEVGRISIEPGGGIVKIDPSASLGPIERYEIVVESEARTANTDTISATSGTPLHLFIPPSVAPTALTVTLTGTDGTFVSDEYTVVFEGRRNDVPPTNAGTTIGIRVATDELRATFAADIDETMIDTSRVLYEWDFGDRNRSLLSTPHHTYAQPGTYAVRLTIRDITTGQTLFSGTTQVTVDMTSLPLPPSEPEEPEPTPGAGVGLGGILRVLLIVTGILALATAIFFLIRLIKNKTAGSLQERLEKMEGKLFEPQQNAEKSDIAKADIAPLALRRKDGGASVQDDVARTPPPQEVIEREKSRRDFNPPQRQPEVPPEDAGPMPDWLKKSPADSTEKKEQASPAPRPAPAPMPPPAAPAPPQEPVPSWLKQSEERPKPTTPPPPSKPEGGIPPPTTQKPTTPASTDSVVPPWLNKTGKQSSENAVSPTPAPSPSAGTSTLTPKKLPDSSPSKEAPKAPVPDWLKQGQSQPRADAEKATTEAEAETPDQKEAKSVPPGTEAPDTSTDAPVPDWLKAGQAKGSEERNMTPPASPDVSPEEQERKRRKRQRYRHNKKLREQAEKEQAEKEQAEKEQAEQEEKRETSVAATPAPAPTPAKPAESEAPKASDAPETPQPTPQEEVPPPSTEVAPAEKSDVTDVAGPATEKAEPSSGDIPRTGEGTEPIAMIRIDSLEEKGNESEIADSSKDEGMDDTEKSSA